MARKLCILFSLISTIIQGQTWYPVASGVYNSSGGGNVSCFGGYNNELYLSGNFTHSDTLSTYGIARWNGIIFNKVDSGVYFGIPYSFAVHQNQLYAGGNFQEIGGVANTYHIARWNGSQWMSAGGGAGVTGTISALASYSTYLYAGGNITTMGGVAVNRIAKWDGANWTNVAGGVTGGFMTKVNAMAVYNNELYVAGDLGIAGGKNCSNIARWNGTQWDSVGGGLNNYVTSLVVDTVANVLYVGGGFTQAGSIQTLGIAKWDGANWSAVGSDTLYGTLALTMYHNQLYAGGGNVIQSVNGETLNNIYRWDGSAWRSVGGGTNSTVTSMQVYHDTLFVGGYFTQAGTLSVKSIAKWFSPDTTIGIKKNKSLEAFLGNAEPNPFTQSTYISYQLPQDVSEGVLQIKDMQGKLLKLIIITKDKASTEISIDELDNGVYTYSLYINNALIETKRMVLMK